MSNLLDTDWAIDYLNRAQETIRRVDALRPEGIAISIITVAELYEGALNSYDPRRDERALEDFLRPFPIIDLDIPICRIFGIERARLRTTGTLIPDMDLFIGATALRHDLTLLTNNRRHFERLPGLSIIWV
jgi:tRNA(fMet)-specific endonuclease VapC